MRERDWLTLERFDYSPLAGRWGVVRMLAALEEQLRPPPGARLVVQRGPAVTSHGAFVSAADRRTNGSAEMLLWIASFAVPLEIVECPSALFSLSTPGRPAIALPAPGSLVLAASDAIELANRHWLPARARRRVSALATAVAMSTAAIPASGFAATHPAQEMVRHPLDGPGISRARHLAPRSGPIKLTAPHIVELTTHPRTEAPDAPIVRVRKLRHPTGSGTWGASQRRAVPATDQGTPSQPQSTIPKQPVTLVQTPQQPAPKQWTSAPVPAPAPGGDAHRGTGSKRAHPDEHHVRRVVRPTGGAPVSAPVDGTPALQPVPASVQPAPVETGAPGGTGVGSGFAGSAGKGSSEISSAPPASLLSKLFADTNGPPPFLVSIYRRAGQQYGVPWPVLAAINSIESDYGRNLSVSSAGAVGWMQFMPGTWRQYGVDANHDGKANPYDPTDAIFAAARYLAANGAPHDIRGAIFAYNHANWYVDEVLLRARWIAANSHLKVTGPAGRKISSMIAMAELLVGRPYVWGGGHGGWQIVPGYDCSGFVSAVLHAAGYLSAPQTTDTLPSQPGIKAGPGRYVTIFDRTSGGSGHVIIDVNGTFYESGGSAASGGGAGVKKLGQPPYDYLLSFNTILHPAGL